MPTTNPYSIMDSSRLHNTRPKSDRSIWRRAAVHHVVRRRVENNTWQEEWVWRRGGRPRDDARTPRLPGDLPGDGGGACGSAGSSSWRTWRRCGAGTRESSVHRNFGQLTFGTSSEKRGGGLDPGDEKKKKRTQRKTETLRVRRRSWRDKKHFDKESCDPQKEQNTSSRGKCDGLE
jgi:hypothetical protein